MFGGVFFSSVRSCVYILLSFVVDNPGTASLGVDVPRAVLSTTGTCLRGVRAARFPCPVKGIVKSLVHPTKVILKTASER